jgi:hypothetical protein
VLVQRGDQVSAPKSQGDSQDLGVFYRCASSDALNRIDAALRRSTRGLERRQLFWSICGPASLVRLPEDRPGVGHWTYVPEFVGVDHCADRLDLPIEDVKRPGIDHLAVPVAEDRAGLAVHLVRLHDDADPYERRDDRGKYPGHVLGADDASGPLRGLAAAVADYLNISSEKLPKPIDVPFLECVEESLSEFVALPSVGLESGSARVHVTPRPHRELPARRLRSPHRRRDLAETDPNTSRSTKTARSSGVSRWSSNSIFNEGYSATSGDSWMHTDLCAEALRLGRMLASLTPHDTESLGLLALMELQASRLKARTGPDGDPVLLMDQDRTRWDYLLIRRGLATLERIDQLGGTAKDTDWVRIAALYDGLAQISPFPVVELNRGVAVAQAFGPQAGLDIVLPLFDVAELRQYHLLPAVAGDLLCRTGQHGRARKHFLQAASLTNSTRERATMQRRAAECAAQHAGESSV